MLRKARAILAATHILHLVLIILLVWVLFLRFGLLFLIIRLEAEALTRDGLVLYLDK